MADSYRLLIDGELCSAASGATFESHDPSTGEVVGVFADAGVEDAERAIAAARRAFDTSSWATQSRESRIATVRDFVEGITARLPEFIDMETRDAGHTARTANMFTVPLAVEHSRQQIELYSQLREVEPLPLITTPATSWNYVRREPVGVVSAISAFNFPLLLAMWKVAPALVTGCTVVLKPSPYTPGTAALLGAVAAASGLPAGVLNILTSTSIGVGEAMSSSPLVDKVAFTGSTEVGKRIMRSGADTVKHLTLELGGKGANLLLDDADLDVAVAGAAWGFLMHQGQACESGTRLLVPRSSYDEVLDRLKTTVEALTVGPAADFSTDLGPLINGGQVERVQRYVKLGLDQGARLLTGGQVLTDGERSLGHFHAPTVFADVTNDMTIAQEEIFGPVLCVIPYANEAEAIAIANDSPYGLSGSVWSRDIPRAISVAHRMRTGTVWINDVHLLNGYAPFGGYKQSGIGRELGPQGPDGYLQTKHVHVDQSPSMAQKFWYGILGLGD
ncbi:MAG TPA: aldehyde dehydrogenase family protein [Mycobacteriales bacterium]|nr:aldehyde dehydrogenase family protein [Mycobacteriales bacterium]